MLEMLAKYTKYLISADSQVMVVSTNTPAVADQNRVWLRTDAYGRPVGFFLWYPGSGLWRRVPVPRPLEIRMFSGTPSLYFDGTGRGLTTGEWDGWALCNGQNFTYNLLDKFILATPASTAQIVEGGLSTVTIALSNLPRITGTIGELYDFKTGGGMPGFSGLITQGGPRQTVTVEALGTGQAIPIPTLPPYIAVGFAQWLGYQ